MHIYYLADHAHLVPELATLHHAQWGRYRPDESLDERTARLSAACGRGGVPSVVVAIDGDALLGSAMLIESDMDERPELTPWLAGVYVVEAHRGCGYGTALVERIEREAELVGVERLYLYTPDAMEFYARSGWAPLERCEHLGQQVTIMVKCPGTGVATR